MSMMVDKLVHIQLPEDVLEDLPLGDPRRGISHNFDRDLLPQGHRQLALIAFGDKEYRAIGIVDKEGATSSYQDRVRCTFITMIPALGFEKIIQCIPSQLTSAAKERMALAIGTFTRPGGNAIISAITKLKPSTAKLFGQLVDRLGGAKKVSIKQGSPWEFVQQERDAVDTALGLGGIPPCRIDPARFKPDKPMPIMRLLGKHGFEDNFINMDAGRFGGFAPFGTDAIGTRTYYDSYARSGVTIILS